ncbi:MAG: hypothetical protein KatS3mg002_1625 [Candidatus Woesearchaeota archaeon]|nr:MAG: hypothetical protein KatS3mg002_1625 [Candidatus Woesearchaeota archaeon]
MDELIKEIKNLKVDVSKEAFVLMNSRYSPILIEKKNFTIIPDLDNKDYSEDFSEIAFIDGGQAVLFEGASFCIGVIRVVAIIYKENKRVSKKLEEFNVFINMEKDNFIVKTFPSNNLNDIIINSKDEALNYDDERVVPSRVLSIVRRLAELNIASNFDTVVIDGTLEARYPYEIDYVNNLKNAFALSKTCSLTTNIGIGVTDYLRNLMDGQWVYYPVVKNNNPLHPADICFIKLNNNSEYIFRFEYKKNIEFNKVLKIIRTLSLNSNDPVFLGYPYGLIDADQYARFTNNEKKLLQTKIGVKLGKEWYAFSKMLTSMNSHEVLDNIKF